MDNIIEALMQNEKPFGLTSGPMQAKAREIGKREFDCLCIDCDPDELNWDGGLDLEKHPSHNTGLTYRLREDYTEPEPEAGVEKCEVRIGRQAHCLGFLVYVKKDGTEAMMSEIFDDPNLIGCLYANGAISSLPRMYYDDRSGYNEPTACFSEFAIDDIDTYSVLTPTHVLFRGK